MLQTTIFSFSLYVMNFLFFKKNPIISTTFNSLPNDILDWSKLKAFTNDKINLTENFKFGLGRVENIVEKEKMLVTRIFSFSHNVFKSPLFQGCYKSGLYGKELIFFSQNVFNLDKSKTLSSSKKFTQVQFTKEM